MLEFGTKEYHLDAGQIWDKTHEKGSKAKEGLTSGPTPWPPGQSWPPSQ